VRAAAAVAAALALGLAACAPPQPLRGGSGGPVPADGSIRIEATALPLNPKDAAQDRVGEFVFAGALDLKSPDTSLFGGFSDLKVDDAGNLVSETDEGSLLRAHILLDAKGRLIGLDQAKMTLLKGPDGQPLDGKREADSEGVALWPNGDLMVSFERDHRIWVYPAAGGPPRAVPMPSEQMPDNQGMEGLALAPKEGDDAYWVGIEGGSIWLCHLRGGCARPAGQFPPPSGYRLPALFELANGDLVVEHHHWDPFGGNHLRISVIDNPATNPHPAVKAVLQLDRGMTLDNIEGVAVVERGGGVRRFYLISDDNFSPRQRTLLMAFDWTPKAPAAEPGK
jgi:hypothetical protein